MALYQITSIQNLHVGAGGSNYGIIDKLIQRDPVDEYPAFYSSSLKGALREFIEQSPDNQDAADGIFGKSEKNGSSKGFYNFSDVHLLAMPIRSNKEVFFIATCPYLIKKFLTLCEDFITPSAHENILSVLSGLTPKEYIPIVFGSEIEDLRIEDFEDFVFSQKLQVFTELFGDIPTILVNNNDMKYLCSDYALPVQAHNNLENGESTNLWYEQILPRQSHLYFFAEPNRIGKFDLDTLINDKKFFVGANTTTGMGKCTISHIKSVEKS